MKFEKKPTMVLKRKFFKDYTYSYTENNVEYHILVLPVTKDSILTINSKYHWEVKYGKPDGQRFITKSSKLFDLRSFMKYKNKLIVFKGKPYKILKHINECDIEDISDCNDLFDVQIFESF